MAADFLQTEDVFVKADGLLQIVQPIPSVQEFTSFHAPRVKHQTEEGQRFFGFASAGEPTSRGCRSDSRTAMSGGPNPLEHICAVVRADRVPRLGLRCQVSISCRRTTVTRPQAVSVPSASEQIPEAIPCYPGNPALSRASRPRRLVR